MMRAANAVPLLAAVLLGTASAFAASPPNALDVAPGGVTPPPVDMLQTAPVTQSTPERPRELSGNPLWAIPLSSLSATRDRPLFTPSRRPPAPPAVAGPPPAEPAAAAPPPTGPERPQLTLVGAVVGDSGGIAIFLDQTTNDIVRLKTGESHSGWILRSVKGREALFQKNSETLTLALPAPGAAAPPGAPATVPGRPAEPL
jgi:general secretion pathway protein N